MPDKATYLGMTTHDLLVTIKVDQDNMKVDIAEIKADLKGKADKDEVDKRFSAVHKVLGAVFTFSLLVLGWFMDLIPGK